MRTLFAVLLSLLAACTQEGPTSVPQSVEKATTRQGQPRWTPSHPAGPGSVAPVCPTWAPVACGDACCYVNDTCSAQGQCQETMNSPVCPDGTICGRNCYPAGTPCTDEATLCPSGTPVHCGPRTSSRCCTEGSTCTALNLCAALTLPPVGGGVTCADGTYCPLNWTCQPDGPGTWCSAPTPPIGVVGCLVPCPGANSQNCCGFTSKGQPTGPQGTCSNRTCTYPTRPPLPKPCPDATPEACGATMCCAATVSCGECGCPPATPRACGTSDCCAATETCGSAGQCGECTPEAPTLCGDTECCGPSATCTEGRCYCPPGDFECGDMCCPPQGVCADRGEGLSCYHCADRAYPQLCGTECCTSDELCLQCAGEAEPTCHTEACPKPSCGDSQHYAATCPNGTTRCCSVNMVCCRDSMNGGAIGCEFTGFCE